ncbi:MAG: tryptophan synthase subunit alpha [Proteobacteria bacterium]|nr:tryptophan synthase subunit alpha [Pseudomonadota bacterium]
MNRIDQRFASLRARNRKALIPFITAGDPSIEATVPVMHALVAAGVDAIELGVPFSDPMADGPTIQRSSERALARGVGTTQVLAMVRAFRATDADTPVVLMGYLNPVVIRGIERYAHEAAQAGVDGVLLVDLPPEEAGDIRAAFNAQGIALIALAAPTTSRTRLDRFAREAQGYLYYVSFAGVTGASRLDIDAVHGRVTALRAASAVPVVVGFGVRDGATAKALASCADGVVVGSALVDAIAGAVDARDAASRAVAFLAPLRAALEV